MTDEPEKLFAGTISAEYLLGTTINLGPPKPSISPDQCVAQGGHCYYRTGMYRASEPPQYAEGCKHCGHTRWAIPREPYEYREDT